MGSDGCFGRAEPMECSFVFLVFDAPEVDGCWSKRIAVAAEKIQSDFAGVVPWIELKDIEHASRLFREIRTSGGEGLVLHRPGSRLFNDADE